MLSTKSSGALPDAQEKRKPPPLSIQIRQNVRIEDRTDTTLGPLDSKYQETEKYFAALLDNMDWTTARIMDEHFSPHEAKKFLPTQESPWAEWQAEDTRAFERLLQTRFKGVKPTLSMKMALLYHGFSVAPQKIGPIQDVSPRDYQHFMTRENRVIHDPLEFLEGYTKRTWGEAPPRLSFQPRRVPIVTEAMGLRGGALDDTDMEDMMSDDELPLGETGHAGHTKSQTRRAHPASLIGHPRRTPNADAEALDKKTTMYNSQAEFRTGSGTHDSMRKQTWWAPPSIFANPLKPVMPIHGAPLEPATRTGPSVPSVSLGMRTSTEMARLEREVHMYRGHLLDRNRECPYHDCHRFFHYLDTKSFEHHLTQEHAIVRCTLCLTFPPAQKHAGMLYMNRKHIIEHILNEHSEQLRAFLSVPTSHHAMPSQHLTSSGVADPMSFPVSVATRAGYTFCDRCGRDNTKCCESEDLKNHMVRCAEPASSFVNGFPPAYCESCGTKTGSRWPDRSCPKRKCASHKPNFPVKEYFCHKCGLCWNDNHSEAYKVKHGSACRFMGGMSGSFCVHCGVSLCGLDAHGLQNHDRVCMARAEPSGTHIAEQNPLSEGYGEGRVEDNIRETIETWDSLLDQGSRFEPEPDSHCSRCFLQAKDCENPDFHANKDLSCNIHWGKGSAENLPNVSGWVSRGDLEACGGTADEVLHRSAQDFVSKYPDYTPTISDTYLQQTSAEVGSFNDPNINMLTSKLKTRFPWPPSNKRPTADPQSHKRPVKKRRQVVEDSDSELPSDGDQVLLTDSENDGGKLSTKGPPKKGMYPWNRDTSAKPQEKASATHAEKKEMTVDVSVYQASQPPASRQGSAAPAATAVRPATTRRSATPAKRQATVARQRSATPATSTAYPWGQKVQIMNKPANALVEVTVGASSSWGGNPAAATQSAVTATPAAATPAPINESRAPAAEKSKVPRPESSADVGAAPQESPATTRSGRTIRKTRAATELQGEKGAGEPGHADDGGGGDKTAYVSTLAAKKGRPKKHGQ